MPDGLFVTPLPAIEREIDLNELLIEHPAASFIFRCGNDFLIVDRALTPRSGSLVLVESSEGFHVESYQEQAHWGVISRILRKLT